MKTFSDIEYENRKRKTKREDFLDEMDKIVPWDELITLIQPHYYNNHRGRPACSLEKMLRMYLLQTWFSISDEGLEDAIYDSYAFRKFMGVDFCESTVPDATTLLKFRHFIENKKAGEQIFEKINEILERSGKIMHGGSIVDATIIDAPSSTKNKKHERDPEMKSTRKGGEYHFGMKAHVGVDAGTGLVHSVTVTAANVGDVTQTAQLVREDDDVVYGDSGYIGVEKREEIKEDENLSQKEYRICKRPGKLRGVRQNGVRWADRDEERRKSSVRRKVEFVFRIAKGIFGYRKVAYKGLAKNLNKMYMIFASANLLMLMRARCLQRQRCVC